MRVKIGDTWFDADYQPLAVQFSATELEFIQSVDPAEWPGRTFAAGHVPAPEGDEADALREWMREGRDGHVHCTAHVDYDLASKVEAKKPAPELVDCGECSRSSGCVKTCMKWNGII